MLYERIFANFRRGIHLCHCHPAVTWNAPNTLVRCKSVCLVIIVSWTIRSDRETFYFLVQIIVPLRFLPLPLNPFASHLLFSPVPSLASSAYYVSYSTSTSLVFCSLFWSTHFRVPYLKALKQYWLPVFSVNSPILPLTLIVLMWRIGWAHNNARK